MKKLLRACALSIGVLAFMLSNSAFASTTPAHEAAQGTEQVGTGLGHLAHGAVVGTGRVITGAGHIVVGGVHAVGNGISYVFSGGKK